MFDDSQKRMKYEIDAYYRYEPQPDIAHTVCRAGDADTKEPGVVVNVALDTLAAMSTRICLITIRA